MKNISLVIINFIFFEKLKVFFPENLSFMMYFLVFNVFVNIVDMGLAIGKNTETGLPFKVIF